METQISLTPRQERFAQAMAAGPKSFQQAAKDAGYADSHAHTQANANLKNPKIKSRIAELQAEALSKADITPELVLSMLAKEAADPETADGARVRAQELLGKYLAMFKDVLKDETEELDEESLVAVVTADYQLAGAIVHALAASNETRQILVDALESTE